MLGSSSELKSSIQEVRERLLTGDEVAQILNISRAFAFRLMQQGEIQTVHMGRSVRVRREDLEDFIIANLSH